MDIDKCRICLKDGSLSSIFNYVDTVMFSTKIMELTNIEIYPNDDLPSSICSKCIECLHTCINFIDLCQKSDYKLRKSLFDRTDDLLKEKEGVDSDYSYNKFSPKSDEMIDDGIGSPLLLSDVGNKVLLENFKNTQESNSKKSQRQQCFTCGKVMSSKFRLKTHQRTHTGEKPYSCPHCSKNFSMEQNLKVHLRVHTGEKPLQCTICGEYFAHSSGLTVHKRKHSGHMPYQCMLCPRSFQTPGHLQYHVRRHTGEKNFECDTCNRAFITRSDLKRHFITHTGDKPHVCCFCGLRLTRSSHLTRHIRHVHNEQQPFSCNICNSKFAQKCDLVKHIKKHSENDKVEVNAEQL